MVFLICTFKEKRKMDKFEEKSEEKKIEFCRTHRTPFLQLCIGLYLTVLEQKKT